MPVRKITLFFVRISLLILIAGIVVPVVSWSQVNIRGRVTYKKDGRPAAGASVSLLRKNRGNMTDESGNFMLHIPASRTNDTIMISSVGYENLLMTVQEALRRKDFELKEFSGSMVPVTVRSFTSLDEIGATGESVGYFRSWNFERTGGEIGRIFRVPYPEYKVDRIRFKINNMCDTCLIRLHIRKVKDGVPGDELLRDSISIRVKRLALDDKAPEFDLRPYELVLNEAEIFIGFELIDCQHPGRSDCSFCFAGTEPGTYHYKSTGTAIWERTDDFAIYLKIFLRY